MTATILLPTVLQPFAEGQAAVSTSQPTQRQAIDEIASRYPALAPRLRTPSGEPYGFIRFYINDNDVRWSGGFDSAVTHGDTISVIAAVAGG